MHMSTDGKSECISIIGTTGLLPKMVFAVVMCIAQRAIQGSTLLAETVERE
jgi:hypothetical protein